MDLENEMLFAEAQSFYEFTHNILNVNILFGHELFDPLIIENNDLLPGFRIAAPGVSFYGL